jgi:hypothetical protein
MASKERPSIVERDEEIFRDDPLMLQEKNQRKYFDDLLTRMIIDRSMRVTSIVNLNQPRQAALDPSRSLPKEPPHSKLVSDYLRSRRLRTQMPKDRWAQLKDYTMAFNAVFTEERKKFSPHAVANHKLKKKGVRSTLDKRLRIATVGYRIMISRLLNQGYFGEDLGVLPDFPEAAVSDLNEASGVNYLRRTKPIGDRAKWETAILTRIEAAHRSSSHIIVLPEFALPSAKTGDALTIQSRINSVTKKFAKNDVMLFAGTRHEGLYNRGLLIWKRLKQIEDCWHYKIASARKLGENILGPPGITMPLYIKNFTCGGRTVAVGCMVAICYDAFDPTVFLNMLKQAVESYEHVKHLIILVPSFNTSQDFVAMLRDLSFLGRCCVVYVNGLHGDNTLYAYGFSVSEFLKKKTHTKKLMAKEIKRLEGEIDKEEARYAKAIKNDPDSDRSPAEKQRLKDNREMLTALERFQSKMSEFQSDGALDHLITIESKPAKTMQRETFGDDILYYNLDLGLLEALKTFRHNFFLNDKRLPSPLSFRELSRALISRKDGKKPDHETLHWVTL